MKALASLSASAKSCTALSQAEGSLRRLSPSRVLGDPRHGPGTHGTSRALEGVRRDPPIPLHDGRFERSKRDRRLGDEQVEYLPLEP